MSGLYTHDCRNGHHGGYCGMTPCGCVCHANERPAAPVTDHDALAARDRTAEEVVQGDEGLREALARKLTTWVIGVAYENAWNCADALLALPEMRRLAADAAAGRAAQQAVERVRATCVPDGFRGVVSSDLIRTAIEGTDQ